MDFKSEETKRDDIAHLRLFNRLSGILSHDGCKYSKRCLYYTNIVFDQIHYDSETGVYLADCNNRQFIVVHWNDTMSRRPLRVNLAFLTE